MKSCVVYFLTIAAVAGLTQRPFFRPYYQYNAETDSFYKPQRIKANWTSANHRCSIEGASLAYPLNKDELLFILEIVHEIRSDATAVYIGLQDILSQGIFTNTRDGMSETEAYKIWAEGEPSYGKQRNCVILDQEGFMRTVPCSDEYYYVCKKTRTSINWNADCNVPDLEYKYSAVTGKCYKFHLSPQTWFEAYTVCLAEDSYLAVIDSDAEAAVIANVTNKAPKYGVEGNYLRGALSLGFHNIFEDGFQTIFGVPLQQSGYSLWGPGQPDSAGGKELCGSMFYELERPTTTVYLNDIGCDSFKLFFICENEATIPSEITTDNIVIT